VFVTTVSLSPFKGALVPINVRPSIQKALNQLHVERSSIDRQISALTDALSAIGAGVRRRAGAAGRAVKRAAKRRPRRRMTAAQRKAVSRRMKAFWAKRRAKQEK
jgi:hypothetical protein